MEKDSKLPGYEILKGKRGSTNNKRRLDAFGKARAKHAVDWGDVSSDKLLTVVVMITELGGAVTIGSSRDRGSYMLTLLLDGNRETFWYNGDSDVDEELDKIAATLVAFD